MTTSYKLNQVTKYPHSCITSNNIAAYYIARIECLINGIIKIHVMYSYLFKTVPRLICFNFSFGIVKIKPKECDVIRSLNRSSIYSNIITQIHRKLLFPKSINQKYQRSRKNKFLFRSNIQVIKKYVLIIVIYRIIQYNKQFNSIQLHFGSKSIRENIT